MNVTPDFGYIARFAALLAVPALIAACGGGGSDGQPGQPVQPPAPPPPPPVTLEYAIDASVVPTPATLGTRTLGAVRDEAGTTSTFVVDELMISPASAAELDDFLRRTGGTVLRSDVVPDPPVGANLVVDSQYKVPTQYLVRVDPSAVDLASFAADATRAGLSGSVRISDGAAARLLALATRERAAGFRASPNFVGQDHGLLLRSEEHPLAPGGFVDALSLSRFGSTGSRSNVARAWQWIAARGGFTPVRIAILDGGFWLDPLGRPFSALSSLQSDLPERPLQWDFKDDDPVADGENPGSCTGGSPCPWHGNASAGVATGRLDNRYGSAGTGGQVAEPILFKREILWDQVARAIRSAVAWRAAVISMSFGFECDNVFCDGFLEFNLYPALRHARDHNVVMVAAAGNSANDTNMVPCKAKGEGVICVGALADNSNEAISYSNYGSKVDIWAPTNIQTMPDGDTTPNLKTAGGTSASAPFVAGIAAMLKAYDPTLSSMQVRDILRRTAWTDSPDLKVTHYVNAYRALLEVTGPDLLPDRLEPNNSASGPTLVTEPFAFLQDLSLHNAGDRDHFRLVPPQHSDITVTLRYLPQYGAPEFALVPEGPATFAATNVSRTPRSDGSGFTYQATVAPGSYRVVLAGDRAKPYDLYVAQTPRSLMMDAFEVNDTPATAATLPSPGTGEFLGTLHDSADVDYFRFTQLSSIFQTFRFGVTSRDLPLTLRLFDDAGAEVAGTACTTPGPCRVDLPVGAIGVHRVKVEGFGITGRYTFQAVHVLNRAQTPVPAFPSEPLIMIEENAPALRGLLAGLRDIYVFVNVGKSSAAVLTGPGLTLSLFNRNGERIAVGGPGSSQQLPAVQIPLQNLQLNEVYLLAVERAEAPSGIDGEQEMLTLMPYLLGLRE